jgi:hypothetical protein
MTCEATSAHQDRCFPFYFTGIALLHFSSSYNLLMNCMVHVLPDKLTAVQLVKKFPAFM